MLWSSETKPLLLTLSSRRTVLALKSKDVRFAPPTVRDSNLVLALKSMDENSFVRDRDTNSVFWLRSTVVIPVPLTFYVTS